jgi:hypothetical protein
VAVRIHSSKIASAHTSALDITGDERATEVILTTRAIIGHPK